MSWPTAAAIAICLFLGFWAFVYQGYTEDAGTRPIQSWPVGAVLYAVAGVLTVRLIRRGRPDWSDRSRAVACVAVLALLVLAALGALDAGGHSFEF